MSEPRSLPSGDSIGLWSVILPISINAAIGAFFLLACVPAVFALYWRGYGRVEAVVEFVILPTAGILLSVVAPAWLCRAGRRRPAQLLAIAFLPFFWLPYFIFVAAVAAI